MKKIFSIILTVCMLFNMSAFALPTIDVAESAEEKAVIFEETSENTLTPGINVFTGDTNAITFDTEADLDYVSVGSRWTAGAVVDYEIGNISGKGNMLRFKNTNAVTDASGHFVAKLVFTSDTVVDRPAYFIARVYDACTYWAGLGDGWMRTNITGNWASGYITRKLGIDSTFNSNTFQVEPWAIYSNNYWMCIDNVAVIPYYQITYKNILPDGTTGADIVKYELNTDNIAVTTNDGVIAGLPTSFTPACYIDEPEGYTLVGWSTEENATEAMANVSLANQDITLYPVWSNGEADVPVYVLKPGINAFTGNTNAVTFETEEDLKLVTLEPRWDKTAVIEYQIGARTAYNGIGNSLLFRNKNGKTDASGHFVTRITATMPITIDRPAYFIARVCDANTHWYVSSQKVRGNITSDWRNGELKRDYGTDDVLNSDKIYLDVWSIYGNNYNMYLDNLAVIPYYEVTYKNILPDGTTGADIVKYELDTSGISVLTDDGVIAGIPTALIPSETLSYEGYTFMGWTTDAEGTKAEKSIPLNNKDITLYPVWYEGEYVYPGTNGIWDFEMSDDYGWKANGTGYDLECTDGVLSVNTGADEIDDAYISHDAAALDTEKYRYLVLNVRNRSDANSFTFYYTTTTSEDFSDDKSFTMSIEPNKGIFYDIVIDMKQFASWTGHYQNCKLVLHGGGTGYVDFEEIYFTEDYYGDDGMYHYPLYGSAYTTSYPLVGVSPHKSTIASYIRTFSTTANDGYISFPAPTETLDAADYPYFVIKSLRKEGSYEGSVVYYFTTSDNPSKTETQTVYATGTAGLSGFYTYHIFNLSKNAKYTGNISSGMLKIMASSGKLEVVDMFLCDSTDFLENETGVEKPKFELDDAKITVNGESINIKPYLRLTGGTVIDEFTSAKWSIDSVNAIPSIEEDGSLTLTGKINGKVNVKVEFEYDGVSYSDTAVITVSGQNAKLPATKIKLVTYGNSIMLHGPNADLGWYGNWGMAASSMENDYVHKLISMLEAKYGEGNVSHSYGAGQKSFESATSTSTMDTDWATYLEGVTEFMASEQPDIVTVQYGENSTATDSTAYQYALTCFVEAVHKGAPDAVVVLALPWWSYKGLATYTGASNAAAALDLPLADLSAISQNREENWAIGEFEQYAVYSHPGDLGMERIAAEMYGKMLPYLTTAIDSGLEYTSVITGVEITADSDKITTEYGTLALTASVMPESADQSVLWSVDNENIATVSANGVVNAINNGTVTVTATSLYDSDVYDTYEIEISGQTPCYTLSFDKNTDDTVTGMPEDNNYAKGETALYGMYPERETYKFVGWSLTSDGSVTDSVYVTEDTVLYAVWEKASSWSFDVDGYAEGFVINKGFNQKIEDGRYQAIATATDEASGNVLTVVSPVLDIPADDFDKLVIKMQNTAKNASTSIRLTVKTEDNSYNYTLPVTSTETTEYEFNLEKVTGTITGFEFKPTNIDATIFLDEIYFAKNVYAVFYLESELLGVSGASSMKINGKADEITEGKAYEVLLDKGLGIVEFTVNGQAKNVLITANEEGNGYVYTVEGKTFAAFGNNGFDNAVFALSTYYGRRLAGTTLLSADDSLVCDMTGADKAVMIVLENASSLKPLCEEVTVYSTDAKVVEGTYPVNAELVDTTSELVRGWLKYYSYGNIVTYDKTGKSTDTGAVLKWNGAGNPDKYVVTLSTSEDLSDAKNFETTDNKIRVDNLLVATDYYWTVTSVFDGIEAESDVYTFTTAQTARVLNMGGVGNVRDIGGYVTEDGKYRVKQNMAIRGAYLEHVNSNGRALAKEIGINTEIDLRMDSEITIRNTLGVKNYFNIPGIHYYTGSFHYSHPENQAVIASEVRIFANKDNYPIYFHCAGGRDRTGLLAMLIEGVIGVPVDDIRKDFELTWMRGDGEEYLLVAFENLLAFVGEAGGETFKDQCENYLLSIGITEEEIATIRETLLEEIK